MLGVISKRRFTNYNILAVSTALGAFGSGMFGPFWVVFVQQFSGSPELFGFAVGLIPVSYGITSYGAGWLSDRTGRKTLMIVAGFAMVVIVFGYTLVTSFVQLSVLQVLSGMVAAVMVTSEKAFIGDITQKETRGRSVGKLEALAGVISGLAMMGGGLLVGGFGIEFIFYIVAAIYATSTLMLLLIRE